MAPEVVASFTQALSMGGDAGSVGSSGTRLRAALSEARKAFQHFLHARSVDEIIFNSGPEESANRVIKGVAWASVSAGKKHLVLSEIEHPAVMESVRFLESQGFQATRVGVDAQGLIKPEEVRKALRPDTCLFITHHANHDVGSLQPVAELAQLCQTFSIPVFCDATVSGGWLPLDVESLHVQFLSLAPDRFFGPAGVGVLYRRSDVPLLPLIHGGREEMGMAVARENLPAILAAATALELVRDRLPERTQCCQKLQRQFLERLRENVEDWSLNGCEPGEQRAPQHLSLSFLGVDGQALALRLDLKGIEVGVGTGCQSQNLKISPVLRAMGVSKQAALGTLLIGLSETLSEEQLAWAVSEIAAAVRKLREQTGSVR
jgi:cysteine desulfurase